MKRKAASKQKARVVTASKAPYALALVFGTVLVLGALTVGVTYYQDHQTALAKAKSKDRSAALLKRLDEMQRAVDAYYRCVSQDPDPAPTNVRGLANSLSTYNEGKYSTLGKRVRSECNLVLTRALMVFEQGDPVPPEIRNAWSAYITSIRGLLDPMQRFANAASARANEDEFHRQITAAAEKWSKSTDKSPEAARFEQFLVCAIPEFEKMGDRKRLTQWYTKQCTRGDVVPYMNRVRKECAQYLAEPGDAGAPQGSTVRPTAAQTAVAQQLRAIDVKGVGLMRMVLGICTAFVRKRWVDVEGQSLLKAASAVFDAKRTVQAAVHGLDTSG